MNMYMHSDITAAVARPHLDEPRIDPAQRRAELEQVISIATSVLSKSTMRKLGGLSIADARADDDQSYFLQIRSEPIGGSGLEFRFPMPARNTGHFDPVMKAAGLVDAVKRITHRNTRLKQYGKAAWEAVKAAITPATGGISAMNVVAVGISMRSTAGELDTTVDVQMLGCDLKPGIERATACDLDALEEKLKGLVDTHLLRSKALAEATVADATGWIDGAALRIVDAAGFRRTEIVEMLRTKPEVEFHFGGESGYDLMGAAYWDNGVIRGYVESRDPNSTYRLDRQILTIESKGLPATVVASLVGRRLGEVVDMDLVPVSALIVDREESGNLLYLTLEIGRMTIEEALRTTG